MSQAIHGVFNLCKPQGLTSFDVVSRVRRLAKERRVGHAGTLDPDAVGVLPVCLGQATRLVEYLADATKVYCAEIRLGITTDTYDATGRITGKSDIDRITLDRLKETLAHFTGRIQQVPPMFSAVKQEGRRLYQLARAGETVERKPRPVVIYRLDLLAWEPPFLVVEVECSKGTYIRSLAHDLGQELGTGGVLQHLVRLRSGPFTLEDSLSLDQLELAFSLDYWNKLIYPADRMVLHWQAMILGKEKEQAVVRGQAIQFAPQPAEDEEGQDEATTNRVIDGHQELCRAYTIDGRFIAVLRGSRESGEWLPHQVLVAASQPVGEEDSGQGPT